jgi:ParB/RepB/Spo0J family partition protein
MPQLISKPVAFLKPDPTQPRKHFSQAEEVLLGASLKRKQLVPLLARADGTIIDGERRWRAAKAAGLESLDVIITDEKISDSEIKEMQLITAMQREDLTGYEKWVGCSELLLINLSWNQKDLAEHLHQSESMIVRLLSPSKTTAAWQTALKDGKVGISDCYAASKLDQKEQAGLLELKLSGASRDQIEAAGRKTRNGGKETVRVQKVKCPLPSGVCITVSGEAISLDEAIEALGDGMKEMKRAREMGYTSKTFAAAMRDKSKKGGT